MNLNCHLKLSYSHCLNLQTITNLTDIVKLSNFLIVHMHIIKKDNQWKDMTLCLKFANNKTNNYRSCQSLLDFLKLTISPINKEPVRKLN